MCQALSIVRDTKMHNARKRKAFCLCHLNKLRVKYLIKFLNVLNLFFHFIKSKLIKFGLYLGNSINYKQHFIP